MITLLHLTFFRFTLSHLTILHLTIFYFTLLCLTPSILGYRLSAACTLIKIQCQPLFKRLKQVTWLCLKNKTCYRGGGDGGRAGRSGRCSNRHERYTYVPWWVMATDALLKQGSDAFSITREQITTQNLISGGARACFLGGWRGWGNRAAQAEGVQDDASTDHSFHLGLCALWKN